MPRIQDNQYNLWPWLAILYFVSLILVYSWANSSPSSVSSVVHTVSLFQINYIKGKISL